MSKLHCYRTDDGTSEHFVAARNTNEAAALLNVSVSYMRRYGGGRMDDDCETSRIVLAYPNVVFRRPLYYVGRSRGVPRPGHGIDAYGRRIELDPRFLAEFDRACPLVPPWVKEARAIYEAGDWKSVEEFIQDIRSQLS